MKEVVNLIAEYYGVPVSLIYSKNKRKKVCLARQVAMFIIRENGRLGWSDIAHHFEKTHGTIIHAHKVITDMASVYSKFREVIEFLVSYTKYIEIKAPIRYCRPSFFKNAIVL